MKRQIVSAAFGLILAAGTLIPGSATAQAAPSTAPGDGPEHQGMVLHGCVITVGDDEVVFRVSGAGGSEGGRVLHVKMTAISDYDPSTTADACGAIVVYQQDDVWYAQLIGVTRDEDGDVTVNRNSGSRPVGPRGP